MRDRLSLIWLRLSLLPKSVVALLLVAVLTGVGGVFYFTGSNEATSNKVVSKENGGSTTLDKSGNVNTAKPSASPSSKGSGSVTAVNEREATPLQIENLITQVSKESDAERAMKIAIGQIRGNDALLFSCDQVLRKVGVALHKKFGTDAVVGEIDLCGFAVVIGMLDSVYADNGVSDSSTKSLANACLGLSNLSGGCVGATARGYAERRNLPAALKVCGSFSDEIKYPCAWGASATESANFNKKMDIQSCLESTGRVLEGCASAFGGRYSGVDTTLEECNKFKGSAYASCVYGFSIIVALPPKGVNITDVNYRQCAVAKSCAAGAGTILRDSGRSKDQVFAFCKKFEAAVARNECESVVKQ